MSYECLKDEMVPSKLGNHGLFQIWHLNRTLMDVLHIHVEVDFFFLKVDSKAQKFGSKNKTQVKVDAEFGTASGTNYGCKVLSEKHWKVIMKESLGKEGKAFTTYLRPCREP